MPNVPAIQDFVDSLNVAVDKLLGIRGDLSATDRLWPSLNPAAKAAIKAQIEVDLATAKAAVVALQVP